ncbi:hypothetical protein KOR34_13770 [Posidoniimonas corsicana]|uniref:Dockerin domain-containing protein n=2 Tax=Posidoniimonas corsicana TaxID=1938618 RepID=A0A5C5VE91_9BACT|nr:hypothetical protein KOR34_13770 [Posidoniimonas corsicana]
MWRAESHPYGSENVIGDPVRQQEVLAHVAANNFDRLYLSLGNLPLSEPDKVAGWLSSLNARGVEPQMLLGANTWIFPENRSSLLAHVYTRLINYNLTRTDPAERIPSLHLDIEPQGLSNWGSADPQGKKQMLYLLSDTYQDVRSLLDANGADDVRIYADLPVWFDSSSSIGWDDTAERNAWFQGVAETLDGVSMMAFERGTLSSIRSGVDWEVQNLPIEVRIGLNAAEVGTGETFPDFAGLDTLANSIAAHYGDQIGGVDYQPFVDYWDLAPAVAAAGDYNADGRVDSDDYAAWRSQYGGAGAADGNQDGVVNAADYSIWRDALESAATAAAATSAPSPTAAVLAACCVPAVLLLHGRSPRNHKSGGGL